MPFCEFGLLVMIGCQYVSFSVSRCHNMSDMSVGVSRCHNMSDVSIGVSRCHNVSACVTTYVSVRVSNFQYLSA